jgi:periplasmic divalent cation tolerance protein
VTIVSAPVVILVTFPSMEVARSISRVLVEDELAACVNLLPGAESVYRWQGKVEVSREVVGLVKTTDVKVEKLKQRYLGLHPYDVAEFLTIGSVGGSETYLNWLMGSAGTVSAAQ